MRASLRSLRFTGAAMVLVAACGGAAGEPERLPFDDRTQTVGYGDDPALDALWDRCADGDGVACDDLFERSPIGSEYEDFGASCGGRSIGARSCSER